MAQLQKLKYMCSILRGRLKEPKEDKFTDLELWFELSIAQFDVERRLLAINKKWLTKQDTVHLTALPNYRYGTLPSDCLEIESVTTTDYKPIIELPASDAGLLSSSVYEQSEDDIRYQQIGNQIRIYSGTYSLSGILVNHIEKAVELVDEDDETIIPVEFVDFIIAHAEWKCAPKAGQDERQKGKEYDEMYIELERRYQKDIEKDKTGSEG